MTTVIAQLPNGDHLSYLDSGPVPDSDGFTTVIALHGILFNAYCLENLLPLAHKQNIRLILVQRKDYTGSSECTEEERKFLAEEPHKFLVKMGVMIAQFVHHIAVNTRVCKPTKDRSEGGISILGWSLGNLFAMSMFENQGVLDADAYALVESYITNLIIYEPPHGALGVTFSDITEELAEEPQPPSDPTSFFPWVSSYYDQPAPWDGTISKLDTRPRTEKYTLESWSEAEMKKYTENLALRSDFLLLHPFAQPFVRQLADHVLHSTNPTLRAFPLTRVTFIHGRRSPWSSTLAWAVTEKKHGELLSQGHGSSLRPMKIMVVGWGNHFIHFDKPSEFMEIISEAMKAA